MAGNEIVVASTFATTVCAQGVTSLVTTLLTTLGPTPVSAAWGLLWLVEALRCQSGQGRPPS